MRKINGKKIANKILANLKRKISNLGKKPDLAVILVGDDPASLLYIKNKKRAAEKIGVKFELYSFGADNADDKKIMTQIKKLNRRKVINGIIVQLPLPKGLNADKIISAIDPKKDVDGFHSHPFQPPPPVGRGRKDGGERFLVSPVAQAVVKLIEAAKIKLRDKKAVLFVKSEIIAAPIKKMMEKKGIKVEIVAKPSLADLKKYGRQSDIIVIALGKPYILKNEMIKNNAIIIDIGITPTSSPYFRKFVGDLDSRGLEKKKGFYTPVPGGVGPVTVAMLLQNIVKASQFK